MGFEHVASALEDSWRMLAGTPLNIAESVQEVTDLADAHYFAITIRTVDGREHTVALQVTPHLLVVLTSAMFGEPADVLSEEQCHDAGKELANILSSCCIKHIALLENGEVGLPRYISRAELQRIESTGFLAAHFLADAENDTLSLSIIEPGQPT